MEKPNQFSENVTRGGSHGLGYFKSDLPTGEGRIDIGKVHFCLCGKSQNKPFCDESHSKCVDGMVNPWF